MARFNWRASAQDRLGEALGGLPLRPIIPGGVFSGGRPAIAAVGFYAVGIDCRKRDRRDLSAPSDFFFSLCFMLPNAKVCVEKLPTRLSVYVESVLSIRLLCLCR